MSCTCTKIPAGKGKGKVQGFITTTLCQECLDQRAIDAVNAAEQKKYEDANLLIAQKSRQMAEDALIAEGKIEIKDGKTKIKE